MMHKSKIDILPPEPKPNSSTTTAELPSSQTIAKPPVVGSTVILGDCVQLMKRYPDKHFDLAIVDPPYSINITESGWAKTNSKIPKGKSWDNEKPTLEYWIELFRVSKNQIVWGGNYFSHKLPVTESWICWNKKPFLKSMAHFELAWTSFDIKPKMYDYTYAGNCEGIEGKVRVNYEKVSIHPAQKPENIYKMILDDFAKKGFRILDTHLGSQSSRIAADKAGLDFTGFEIDKDYFDVGEKRYQNYKSQLRIEGW